MKVSTKKACVFGFGGTLFVIGIVIGACWNLIFTAILQSSVGLTPTSTSFELWEVTPIPMYMDLYMWDWVNVDEVMTDTTGTVKPKFVEHGPYVFSEVHVKVNMTWNSNHTITFLQERYWQFVPEQSNGSLSDNITSLDVIAATVTAATRGMGDVVDIVLNYAFKKMNKSISITKTAGEWLFDGYEDPLLQLASELNLTIALPFTKFGWFAERNGSALYDGYYTMYTGTDKLEKLGALDMWNYKKDTPFYEPPCNEIFGTLGELGPPMKGVMEISIFASDFCTAFTMKYEKDMDKLGVVGNKYTGTISPFDYTSDDSKRCYCPLKNGTSDCPDNGVINVSKCRYGAPVYVGYPHFYLADESYREGIEGMKPDRSHNEFYLAIEPISGIPLEVRGRLQINIKMEKFKGIDIYSNAPEVFMPTIWFIQRADLTEDKVGLVKLLVLVPAIGMGTFFGLAGIGALMLAIGLVLTIRNGWTGDEGEQLVPSPHQQQHHETAHQTPQTPNDKFTN